MWTCWAGIVEKFRVVPLPNLPRGIDGFNDVWVSRGVQDNSDPIRIHETCKNSSLLHRHVEPRVGDGQRYQTLQ